VLSGRGLCVELITRPEELYRLWCLVLYDLETSRIRRPWPTGTVAPEENVCAYIYIYIYIQGVPGGMCQTSGECSLC